MKLRKLISGGQIGADEAGLFVAKRFGLQTGGTIPKGFRTLKGSRPDLVIKYGLVEHSSDKYPPRTYANVKDSDGTVRFAGDFGSPGEVLTLKAVKEYGKPYFDVDLSDPPDISLFTYWFKANNIEVLNVAGNSEETYLGSFAKTASYLTEAFFSLGLEMKVTDEEILEFLCLNKKNMVVFTSDRQ